MELKEFIKQSLSDIVSGVKEAKEDLKEDIILCPTTDKSYNGYPSMSFTLEARHREVPITIVNFKVQVQVEESNSTDKNVTASALRVFNGKYGNESSQSNSVTNEISFSVPLAWKKMGR